MEIWLKGGWAMIATAFISLFIFMIGVGVSRRLRSAFGRITRAEWRLWIVESKDREGPIGDSSTTSTRSSRRPSYGARRL